MLRSGTTGAALEPLRTRFRVVAREVTGGLGAISARVYELPEAHRPALLAGVLDLERKQLQLRQYVEQMPLGDGADPQVLENAVRQQLELLANVTALAQRVGLIPPKAPPPPVRAAAAAASRARPSYHHEFANALDGHAIHAPPVPSAPAPPPGQWGHTGGPAPWPAPPAHASGAFAPQGVPHPGMPAPAYYAFAPHPGAYPHMPHGYYMPVPPDWPQFLHRRNRGAEADRDVGDDDRDEADDAPRRRRRYRDDEEPPRRAWSPLGKFTSIGLMLMAVGGVAVADRMYRHSARGDKLAMVEQPASEPEPSGAVIGKKFRGRLHEEHRSDEPVRPPGQEPASAAEARAPALAEQPRAARPAGPAPAPKASGGAEPGVDLSLRGMETKSAGAGATQPPPVKLLAKAPKPAATPPSPQPVSAAPPPKIELAVAVPPPAVAAKQPAPKPAPPPADPEVEEPSGALFVPVLSTHKDAKAAREAFSELQKQHVAVLGAKQSEVQTSGGETGTWHRLVVTPASTKEAATEVCNKLRAAGYGRCWVKPY